MSNFQVWNTNLSGSEITTLYNNGTPYIGTQPQSSNLQGWWKLDASATFDGSNWSIPDSSSNSNTGTSSGMTASNLVQSTLNITTPYSRYALSFDGTNDYINSSFSGDVYACSLWFKPSSVINAGDALQYLISFGGTWDGVVLGEMTASLTNELILITDSSITGRSAYTAAGGSISADWHHLCLNWTGSVYEIWLDGTNVQNATTGTPTLVSASALQIGRRSNSSHYNFDGSISNVSIWNAALTSTQITELYNQGKPSNLNNHSAYSNLVSWWQLGENSSFNTNWTVLDEKGTNNGTSANMTEADLVNGVGTSANGLSSGMGGADNIIGDAPYSTANAVSYGMGADAKSTSVPS